MFELFKRAKSEVMVAAGFKTEAEIIAEIHAAVDGAEDSLLREAELILAQPIAKADTHIVQKAERLEKLGFTKAPEVQKASGARAKIAEDKRKKEMNLELAELIRYYKQTYPFQKFLTIEELDRICDKYGLIHAPVSAFRGTVPDKNLAEIERVQELKACDIELHQFQLIVNESGLKPKETKAFLKHIGLDGIITLADVRKIVPERNGFWSKEKYINTYIPTISSLRNGTTWLHILWESFGKREDFAHYVGGVKMFSNKGLFICAPAKEFDLSDLAKNGEGYQKAETLELIEVRDPVVYRYVRGGVQVLSKWGLEASDTALLNEIDN